MHNLCLFYAFFRKKDPNYFIIFKQLYHKMARHAMKTIQKLKKIFNKKNFPKAKAFWEVFSIALQKKQIEPLRLSIFGLDILK